MKLSSDLLILLVLISWLMPSCEYNPDGNNYRDLQLSDSNLSIHIDISPDTFPAVLEEPVLITYRYHQANLSLLGVRIYAGDYTLFESMQLQDSFLVSPTDFNPGNIKLTFEIVTESKSRSLADLTGHEALVFRRDWEFYKPYVCYSGLCISQVFNDGGMLKIEWDTTALPGFSRYIVYKMCGYFDSPQAIAEITDRNQTWYYDWEYFGNWADYRVEAELENQTLGSPTVPVHYLYPGLEVLWVMNSDILMYWNKSDFDKVVLGYELSYANSDTTSKVLYATDNPADTTFLLNGIAAAKPIPYTLRVKIRGPEPGQSMWSDFVTSTRLTYLPRYHLK